MINNKKTKKIIFSLLFFVIVMTPHHNAYAGVWGENIASELMGQALDVVKNTVAGTTMASLKQMVIRQVKKRASELYSGAGNKGVAVGDYNEFITRASKRETRGFVDDFFDNTSSNSNNHSDYARNMIADSRTAVKKEVAGDSSDRGPDIKVEGDVIKNLFNENKKGGADAFASMLSNDANNHFGNFLNGTQASLQKKEDIKEERKTEVISGQGFKTVRSDGSNVFTPGSVWAEMAKKSKTSDIDLLVNADNMYEVMAIAGSNLASGAVDKFSGEATSLQDEMLGLNDKYNPKKYLEMDASEILKEAGADAIETTFNPWSMFFGSKGVINFGFL